MTNIVDGKTESNDICDIFADKYKAIFQSCPSSISDIHMLHKRVNDKFIQENVEKICVTDMEKAFTRLKFSKSDGNHCCNSYHFKFAPKRLVVLFSLLFECILYHGYTSEDLLYSTIVSIPKDVRGNLATSENYRGMALSNALCKIIDTWILDKLESYLQTSNYQFAYKSNHSTVMCSMVLKEIISYYSNKGSDVYVCLMEHLKLLTESNFLTYC